MQINDKYELIFEKDVNDIHSKCYYLKHKKTGMRVLILSNDDNNKVFSIGFTTQPQNNTGVAHILEHSVLCGSEKYPLKDPFVELVKGSLNTFLNAMTYPDKTLYPVASTNNKDFRNLMSVYLDAVFNPNIYKHKEIFMQEGWHYCIENEAESITYSGVVYNEMKGVYSSASDILSREVEKAMFTGSCYGYDSGGDPDFITDLTYEEFLDFHRKNYNPSNAYLYLYGNVDINDNLKFIDEEYASKYDRMPVDEIKMPDESNCQPIVKTAYSVSNSEELNNSAYFSYNVAIDINYDKNLYIALDTLSYVLVNAPGSPISKALHDANIGEDVSARFVTSLAKPLFTIEVANADSKRFEEFKEIIDKVLNEQINNKLNKDAILGSLNADEFKFREADFGRYPKGLIYYLTIMTSWLYNDDEPILYIEQLQVYDYLRKNIDTGYFENIIKANILENNHKSVVCVYPELDLQKQKDEISAKKLNDYKLSLNSEELHNLIKDKETLKKYQSEADDDNIKECLPLLRVSDIEKEAKFYEIQESKENNITMLWHECETNDISYVKLMFSLNELPQKYYSYVGILSCILSMVDTENYAYVDLDSQINKHLGGLAVLKNIYLHKSDKDKYKMYLTLEFKCLSDKMQHGIELSNEILLHSKLDDKSRIREILLANKVDYEEGVIQSGNVVALRKAMAIFSKARQTIDLAQGLAYYDKLNSILSKYDEEFDKLKNIFTNLIQNIISIDKLTVFYTGDKAGYDKLKSGLPILTDNLNESKELDDLYQEEVKYVNTGIIAPSSTVQYVARAGYADSNKFKYHGSFNVLKVLLSYDYLWNEIRVKGGAYGCSALLDNRLIGGFSSYRDPALERTEKIYEALPEYIRKLRLSERDINKYIIGAISDMDTPLSSKSKGNDALLKYMSCFTKEETQRTRDEVLACTNRDINNIAEILEEVLSNRYACTVGSKKMIMESEHLFDEIRALNKQD